MSPRTSASNFVMTIASKRAKQHLTPLMARLVEVMNTYAAAGGGVHRMLIHMTLLQLPVKQKQKSMPSVYLFSSQMSCPWPCRAVVVQQAAELIPVQTCFCAASAAKAANGGRVAEPLARQMDGALLAIGALADTLKAKVSNDGTQCGTAHGE